MAATTEQTVAAWDRAAAGWDDHGPLIRAWLADATEAMLAAADLRSGIRVLDVAAGAGDQTIDIARRIGPGGSVLATDISPAMVELAGANLRRLGLFWAETRIADAEMLELEGARFDAAVCRLGLMFCRRPLVALRGIYGALVKGGRFAALVFSCPEAHPCIAIMTQIVQRYASLPPGPPPPGSLLSLGSPGMMAQLLEEAGFLDVEVKSLAAPFCVPRCSDYLDFVRSSGSPILDLLRPLPIEVQQRVWTEIESELARFMKPTRWEGPNELLLCVGAR